MAEYVPIQDRDGVEFGWIIDDVAMELVGLYGDNATEDHWFIELYRSESLGDRFKVLLPANEHVHREQIIPSSKRVPVTRDAELKWVIPFGKLVIDVLFKEPRGGSPAVNELTWTLFAATADNNHLVSYPAVCDANDGALVWFTTSNGVTHTTPTGFTLPATNNPLTNGNLRISTFIKVLAGSEDGGSFDVVTSGITDTAIACVARLDAGTWKENVDGIHVGTAETGDLAVVNPPAFSPPPGSKDYTWFYISTQNDNNDVDVWATNYAGNGQYQEINEDDDIDLSVSWYSNEAASEDGGNQTWDNQDDAVTFHVAVEPPAGGEEHTEEPTDDAGVTDSTTTAKASPRVVTDDVGVTDSTTPVKASPRTATDDVGVTDSVATAKAIPATATDDVGVADSTTAAKATPITVADDVGVTDDTSAAKAVPVTITEAVGVADVVAPAKAIVVTITEAIGIADATSAPKTIGQAATEAVGVTDDTSRVAAFVRTVTDAVDVTDDTTEAEDNAENITEAVGVTDDVSRVVTSVRSSTEAVGVTDAVAAAKTVAGVVADDVGVTDSTTSAKTIAVTITESVGATDATTPAKTIPATVIDAVGVTDTTTPAKAVPVTITDVVGVVDNTLEAAIEGEVATEAVGVTDTIMSAKTINVTINESVGVTEVVVPVLINVIPITITDAVGATDAVSGSKTAGQTVTENVGVIDATTFVQARPMLGRTTSQSASPNSMSAEAVDVSQNQPDQSSSAEPVTTSQREGPTTRSRP